MTTTETRVFDCADAGEKSAGITEATSAIRRGELVVVPTDTVYGVAADAFNPAAIAALLAAKGRGRDMPVPVLVSNMAMLDALVDTVPATARDLVDAFWPGALTLVLRHTAHLAWDLGESLGTVAVRMPADLLALELIGQTGPLGVSSANRTGHPPAVTMLDARLQLGAAVAVYLDGGPRAEPVPSTIVDLTGTEPRLLRAGAITPNALRDHGVDPGEGDSPALQ